MTDPEREDNGGRRKILEALEIQQRRPMMDLDAGLILDPLWAPYVYSSKERKSRDMKCLCGKPQPYLRRAFFMALRLAEGDPHGQNVWDGELSSTDCIS